MGAIHEIMGRPAVSVAWMVEEGIITLANCKKMVIRRDLEQASRGSRNHPALVFVDNMPLRFRGQVIAKLGDIYEAMETTILDIQHDAAAAQFFGDYITEGNRLLPADKRREYYGTACVLNAISLFIETGIGKSKVRGYRHRTPWETIMAALPHVDQDAFPFKLPDNQRSLERKWQRYKEEGYESLVHKNFKTKGSNAAKLLDDDQQNALLELLAMPQNWGMAKVTRLYNSVAKKQGWKEVTVSTVTEFAKKHTPDIRAARLGRSALRNTVSMQVKRTRPTTPLLFWTLDGWTAELFYRDEKSDYNRLTLEVVLDTFNNYPVGYAIADRETSQLISAAMRNAELHIKELFGSMYRVAQVQADNYARTAMEPIYNGVSKIFTPAAVGNAKSKVIEPYFKELNRDYCANFPNWSGYGVTASKESQPNPDALRMRAKSFPTKEECIQQVIKIINLERAKKREKYMEGFQKIDKDSLLPMSFANFLSLWGEESKTKALLGASGLLITIDGVKRTYDCFDLNMRRQPSERWTLKYDPRDPSRALAISEDQRMVFEVEEKYMQPMAIADRKPGDAEQLKRISDFNKAMEEEAVKTVSEASGTVARLLGKSVLSDGSNPAVIEGGDVFQKMVLTDKKGRHKDVLSELRTKAQPVQEEEDEDDIYSEY